MINLDEVDKAILELEQHDTTFATCEKLAWLYTVRDHLKGTERAIISGSEGGSEFLTVCQGMEAEKVLRILDEHMECVRTLYPREYESLLNKMRE